jgi:hypothetical protein
MRSAREKFSERPSLGSQRASRQPNEASPLNPLLGLQQPVGNQALLRLLRAGRGQAKPRLSSSGDALQRVAGGCVEPPTRRRSGLALQRKCAQCAVGAPCSECADDERVLRKAASPSSTRGQGIIQRAANATTAKSRAASESGPEPTRATGLIVEDVAMQPATSSTPSITPSHWALGEITEEIGRAWCDPDKGKMVFELKTEKIPSCLLDCAKAHELAHVQFGKEQCSKVLALSKKADEASAEDDKARAEARDTPSKANVRKAQDAVKKSKQAAEVFKKAVADHRKWHELTCRQNEGKAYQAGIDACKGPKIQKQCADSKQTNQHKKMMKDWEDFKKNPPNCSSP